MPLTPRRSSRHSSSVLTVSTPHGALIVPESPTPSSPASTGAASNEEVRGALPNEQQFAMCDGRPVPLAFASGDSDTHGAGFVTLAPRAAEETARIAILTLFFLRAVQEGHEEGAVRERGRGLLFLF